MQSCLVPWQSKTSTRSALYSSELLEVSLGTSVLAQCLSDPLDAPRIVKEHRSIILKQDFESLLVSASSHQSTKRICDVARITSWRKIWDYALDRGARGTKLIQILFKAMSTPVFGTRSCTLCRDHIDLYSFLDHLCEFHLNLSTDFVTSCVDSPNELFEVAKRVLFLYQTRH